MKRSTFKLNIKDLHDENELWLHYCATDIDQMHYSTSTEKLMSWFYLFIYSRNVNILFSFTLESLSIFIFICGFYFSVECMELCGNL